MRLNPSIYHEDEVDIHCTDTDNTVRGDVIEFNEGVYLSVAIAHSFKINLQYNKQHNVYIGKHAGLEFQSNGPKRIA
jgi:hypothetical protein